MVSIVGPIDRLWQVSRSKRVTKSAVSGAAGPHEPF